MPRRSPARCAAAGRRLARGRPGRERTRLTRSRAALAAGGYSGVTGKQRGLLSATGVCQVPIFSAAPPSARPEVYRRAGPVVFWWIWLAFALFNIVDLAVQGSGQFTAVVTAILVTITGVVYACALRPRVVA